MKRIVSITLMILLILPMVLSHNTVQASCNTQWISNPSAEIDKKLSAIRLTLANDRVLFDVRSNASYTSTAVLRELHVIFAIDTGSSMLNTIKQEVNSLVDALYNVYSSNPTRLRIGIIGFDNSSSGDGNVVYGANAIAVKNNVNGVTGNKSLETGLRKAYDRFENITVTSTSREQALVLFTDSVASNSSMINRGNTVLRDMLNTKMISIHNVIITPSAIGSTVTVMTSAYVPDASVMNQALTGVRNMLTSIVSTSSTNALQNLTIPSGDTLILLPDGVLMIELDNEIMHGAILEVEYTIQITMSGLVECYKLTDKLTGDMIYTPGTRLLTEPTSTNAAQGWIEGSGEIYMNNVGASGGPGTTTITKKIAFFTTLSPSDDSDHIYYNTAIANFNFTTSASSSSWPDFEIITNNTTTQETRTAVTPKIVIIPPTGVQGKYIAEVQEIHNNYLYEIIGIVGMTVLLGVIAIERKRNHRNR